MIQQLNKQSLDTKLDSLIDGLHEAQVLRTNLSAKLSKIKAIYNLVPKLAIIIIGNNSASEIYVKNKIQAATILGIDTVKVKLDSSTSLQEIEHIIHNLNFDISISGIIIQLPVPQHLLKRVNILSLINPEKDVDGFHPINVGYLHNNYKEDMGFIPCTALSCLYLAKKYLHNLSGKHVSIVGRSNIVGKPSAALFLQNDATVTLCHSKTRDLASITKASDLVITAIGRPQYFNSTYFNPDATVIDVGINKIADNKIVGDVDFSSVVNHVKYITPVPKGVGPMTVTFLLINTLKAMLKQHKINDEECSTL